MKKCLKPEPVFTIKSRLKEEDKKALEDWAKKI